MYITMRITADLVISLLLVGYVGPAVCVRVHVHVRVRTCVHACKCIFRWYNS